METSKHLRRLSTSSNIAVTKDSNPDLQMLAPCDEADGVSVEKKTETTYKEHFEYVDPNYDENNLCYDEEDQEPELHARTYVALFAMFILNGVQVLALQGPPAVVSDQIEQATQI